MNIPEGLVAFLSPTIDVYPDFVPENYGRPAATYRLISHVEPMDHDGPTGLITERYQITVYADTHAAALEAIRSVRRLFRGFSGHLGAGVRVDVVEIAGMNDLGYSPEAESFAMILDVNLSFVEV
jgi:hypothetical protein